jgi:RNA polymerase sigma-70 factor (ECF subfamily)
MNTILTVTPELRADADADAVAAIRQGDRERYRELVERHSDRVFAVAWCRLGDRDLAEEVTQEAFIKGYRRLVLLGKAERFGAWITAIARNLSINLGLSRRSELRKREQWALEHSAHVESDGTASSMSGEGERPAAETLRETLAGLPAIHRECLVLFYLEGKSIAEAADVLGLSETAFKTRLHRARAALRTELENQLETDLTRLRPSPGMASMIMLALPLGKPALSAAGIVTAAVAKLSPAAWLGSLVQLFAAGPAVLSQYWISKKETENLRDQDGMRARNIVRFRNAMIAMIVATLAIVAFMNHVFEIRRVCQILAVLTLASCAFGVRQMRISRHRNVMATWMGTGLLGLAFLGVGFFGWNAGMLAILQGMFFLLMSVMLDAQPLRPDLSLFLAAQSGSLPSAAGAPGEVGEAGARGTPRSMDELFAFAKFLGARMLAFDWRRGTDRLQLRLAPVTPSTCLGCFPAMWGDASTVTLFCDGRVKAHLGAADRKSLAALSPGLAVETEKLEAGVSRAAALALESVRGGSPEAAENQLGQEPAAAVYRMDPGKTRLAVIRKWALRGVGLLIMAEGFWMVHYLTPAAGVAGKGPILSTPQLVEEVAPPVAVPPEEKK